MKIGFFITARLKSSRLKQKILLDLNGKSVLDRVIERCKVVYGIDGVVLCTSTNSQDSILFDSALRNQIQFYAGSEDDVLDRLLSAANYYNYDAFLSITADNPLFSIYYSQIAVDWYKNEGFDFIFTKGLPIGCASYLIDVKALQVANFVKNEIFTEIWGPFVKRSDFFNIGEIIVENSPFKEEKRITCDYPEDYNFLRKIYSNFDKNCIPRIQEVFDLLQEHPSIWNINADCKQMSLDETVLKKIQNNFDSNKESGQEYAKSINKKLLPGLKKLNLSI